jgi:hypothetical protein
MKTEIKLSFDGCYYFIHAYITPDNNSKCLHLCEMVSEGKANQLASIFGVVITKA